MGSLAGPVYSSARENEQTGTRASSAQSSFDPNLSETGDSPQSTCKVSVRAGPGLFEIISPMAAIGTEQPMTDNRSVWAKMPQTGLGASAPALSGQP